jgi:hypothetical protein
MTILLRVPRGALTYRPNLRFAVFFNRMRNSTASTRAVWTVVATATSGRPIRRPATGQKLSLQAKIFIYDTGMCARPASEADFRDVAPKSKQLDHCFQYVKRNGSALKRDVSYMIATQHIEW